MQYRHLHEIDALRGLAACGVAFFSHAGILTGVAGGPLVGWPGFDWLYEHGRSLVDLFFVLSGFVMCHVYLDRGSGRIRDGVCWRDYLVARLARLYPLHLLTLILVALLLAAPAVRQTQAILPYDAYHFALHLLFLQRSGLETFHSFNISAWSLTAEMAAYLAFYVTLRTLGGRVASAALLVVLLSVIALNLGVLNLYVTRGLVGFFIGALLWWHWPAVSRLSGALLLTLLAAGFWLTFQLLPPGGVGYLCASLLVWPPLIALACRGALSRALAARPLQWLGEISFSVYLLHLPVYLLRPLLWGPEPTLPELVLPLTLSFTALVLGLSHLSYRWFEMPMRRLVRQTAASRPRLALA